MKRLPLIALLVAAFSVTAAALPDSLALTDGRVLEQVTAATLEDGKVKVAHSGGVSRFEPSALTPAARRSLGLVDPSATLPEVTRLETLDGKTYEDISSLSATPSFISFVHRDGSATVRYEQLPEPLRKSFAYDPQKSAAYEAELAAQAAAEESHVDQQLGSIADATARKQAARDYVIAHGYRDDRFSKDWKRFRDKSSLQALIKGGYDPDSAAAVLEEIKKAALAKHHPTPPGFTQTEADIRAQLRGVPSGTYKSKALKSTHERLEK